MAGSYGGSITRYDHKTRKTRGIIAWPQVMEGLAQRDLKYRFQWNAPVILSKHEPGTLYHAAQHLLRSRDEEQTWEEVSPDLSRNDKATAYVAATMYQFDDCRPYTYKTNDFGKTWTKIVNSIPDRAFTRVVREDPGRRGMLFTGTESGLFSFDDGANWAPFQRNLPAEADGLAEPGDEGEDEDEEKPLEPVAGVNREVWDLRQSAPTRSGRARR